jgi:hypothetical protein
MVDFAPAMFFIKLRQWQSVFWIIRLSQLSAHTIPTITPDNGEHTVAICVLEDITKIRWQKADGMNLGKYTMTFDVIWLW